MALKGFESLWMVLNDPYNGSYMVHTKVLNGPCKNRKWIFERFSMDLKSFERFWMSLNGFERFWKSLNGFEITILKQMTLNLMLMVI